LLLLFIPLSILIWIWRRPTGRVVFPMDYGRQRRGLFWLFAIKCATSTAPLLLAVAIIFLAGPRHLGIPKSKREVTNIEFCLDLSGSMTAPFGDGSRYDASMAAINEFVAMREGDAYGLTIFANKAAQWIPLTTDASAFKNATPFLQPSNMFRSLGGGTMIGAALQHCNGTLSQREEGDRMIILVSDGASADLDSGNVEKIAKELSNNNVVLYSIHIGGGPTPTEVAAISNITGGATFSPGDAQALTSVFRRIDSMQVTKTRRSFAELLDYYFPFSIAGLSFLGLGVLAAFGLRFTPW
jgi:Ca-activated chloride channel homolog